MLDPEHPITPRVRRLAAELRHSAVGDRRLANVVLHELISRCDELRVADAGAEVRPRLVWALARDVLLEPLVQR
jgi:hypothetical protein